MPRSRTTVASRLGDELELAQRPLRAQFLEDPDGDVGDDNAHEGEIPIRLDRNDEPGEDKKDQIEIGENIVPEYLRDASSPARRG